MEIEMKEIRPVEISHVHLSYMIGVIAKEEILRFKRILFRVTKGNIFNICEEINMNDLPPENREDTNDLSILKKAFFILIYQSGESGALTHKLVKICESFGANRLLLKFSKYSFVLFLRFDMPKSLESFNKKLEEIDSHIGDTENVRKFFLMGHFYLSN